MSIDHKRYKPDENRHMIDEEAHIFIPGVKVFEEDFLYKWLKQNENKEINLSLLFHKFPRWFKELDAQNNIADITLARVFEKLKHKKANPANPGDYKKVTHSYKNEHLEDIIELTKRQPQIYEDLKKRYFFEYTNSFTLKTKMRLLIGFAGSDTILENSLSLHPYYGFPVIPGSSLKGLARHYCREFEQLSDDVLLRLFGNESGEKDTKEGEVVFFDAWPEKWPADGEGLLELDVMSPHYTKYYDKQRFPGDDQDPIPIIFLAVRKGIEFRFSLRPSRICKDKSIVALAKCYLEKALKTFGAGAKTGSSYGYFE